MRPTLPHAGVDAIFARPDYGRGVNGPRPACRPAAAEPASGDETLKLAKSLVHFLQSIWANRVLDDLFGAMKPPRSMRRDRRRAPSP